MTVYCDYCGHKAALVDDSEIYGRSFGHTAYLCRNCGAYVGCHGRTDKPLGRLADATLREWKSSRLVRPSLENRAVPRAAQSRLRLARWANGTSG